MHKSTYIYFCRACGCRRAACGGGRVGVACAGVIDAEAGRQAGSVSAVLVSLQPGLDGRLWSPRHVLAALYEYGEPGGLARSRMLRAKEVQHGERQEHVLFRTFV